MSEFATIDPVAFVVAAQISQHPTVMNLDELRDLIMTVRCAFKGEATVEPAVKPAKKSMREVKASIMPDGIVSFEDGKTYKTLTRHLSRRGMTADEYRAKHGLPSEYPMVAPEYSKKRAELAKRMGLGTHR